MTNSHTPTSSRPTPWNKGRLIGQRPPLKLPQDWSIRIKLQISKDRKALALFNLAIEKKGAAS